MCNQYGTIKQYIALICERINIFFLVFTKNLEFLYKSFTKTTTTHTHILYYQDNDNSNGRCICLSNIIKLLQLLHNSLVLSLVKHFSHITMKQVMSFKQQKCLTKQIVIQLLVIINQYFICNIYLCTVFESLNVCSSPFFFFIFFFYYKTNYFMSLPKQVEFHFL